MLISTLASGTNPTLLRLDMNKEEQALYLFLKSLPDEVFDNWLANASDEEILLADRLFDEVRYGGLDKVDDLYEAKQVLKQFTLRGQK